jgi:serine/threonine protein kinase
MSQLQPLNGKFGQYLIGTCLRNGGMGVVFTGWTRGVAGFSQRVAIKRIHPQHCRDQRFQELFRNEARLCAYLRHSNLVRVFGFDEDEEGLFMVMEYVDGVALDSLLVTGPLPYPLILFAIAEVLRGLAYMHDLPLGDDDAPLGIVHRDVTPHNVLLSWDGTVQVADLGIAKQRNTTQVDASRSRGKDQYMSPEQAAGLPLDGRSDVFVVGVLLWEMLFGAPPVGVPSDVASMAPSERLPRSIEAILMQMLARRPEDRPSAADALSAILACADFPRSGRDMLAKTLRERFPCRAPAQGRPVPTEETQERPRLLPHNTPGDIVRLLIQRRRRRNALLVALAVGVAGVAAGAIHGLGGSTTAPIEVPVLLLPQAAEPLTPAPVRVAAPERAPSAAPTPRAQPRPPERARMNLPRPAASTTAAPEAPANDFRVIDLPPEKPEPIRTGAGERSWVQP